VGPALFLIFLGGTVSRAGTLLTMPADKLGDASAHVLALMGGPDDSESSPEAIPSALDEEGLLTRLFRCPTPARPHRLHVQCVGKPFDSVVDTLSRDWAGFRAQLARMGITPTAAYTTQLMGNPSGGLSRGFTYAGVLDLLVASDLQTLLGAPGLSFTVGASWLTGQSLSAEDIGNVFAVQSAFSGSGTISLQQMYLQQQVFDGALTMAAGRLAPANMFATLPVLNNYLNGGINPVPGSLGINDPAFAQSPPGVEWGAHAMYRVTRTLEVSAGVYNTNAKAAAGSDHGVNFALQQGNSGVLTVAQVDYLVNQAEGVPGMPGQYTIGGFYDSNVFNSLSDSRTVRGDWAFYVMFQQMVYRDGGPASQRGLTVWGEIGLSPKPSASPMPYFLGGGVSYEGLIPGRPRDIASLGVISGAFSRYLRGASAETVIEANYQVMVTPWLSGTPGVQYVIKPSGNSGIKSAVVLGLQLAVTF